MVYFRRNLKYPVDLHDLHNDYHLAPEKLKVDGDILSKYCSNIANKYGLKVGKVSKLIPNLGEKESYVIHYKNIKLYKSLRMEVTKIRRVLKFKQSD